MLKKYSSLILRIGLGFVVLWFSINQLLNPEAWTTLIPDTLNFINPITLIYINSIAELIIGILLFLGLFTRIIALLFSLHLIPIIFSLGFGPSATRDIGLFLASLSLAFSGSNFLSLDKMVFKGKIYKKKKYI